MTTDYDRIADPYDRRAYERLLNDLSKGPSIVDRMGGRAAGVLGAVGRRASAVFPSAVIDGGEQAIRAALTGLQHLTVDPAMRSVRRSRVLRRFEKRGAHLDSIDQIRDLDLRTVDDASPALSWPYALATAVEGAGAGLVITGGEALAAAGSIAGAGAGAAPGAGTVLGAMAFDAAAVLAASARVVAHTAACYGYDVRQPEEQVYALSVISWSSAGTEASKTAAFQQLSRLTQQLMRRATWAQLEEHILVKVVQEMYARLGTTLTQRKLGQAVPVAGILIGAGLNASLLRSVAEDARSAYRLRFLTDKYGLEGPAVAAGSERGVGDVEILDVNEILHELEGGDDPGGSAEGAPDSK